MDHDNATLIALATTAAERWPLINTLPLGERERVMESLRSLRVRLHSDRVTSGEIPGRPVYGPTETPGISPDSATRAGTLARGDFRGIRVQATSKHAPGCAWAQEVWPLTPAGDVVPCTCGLAERLEGPIAASVQGTLWVRWLALWQEEEAQERAVKRKELERSTARERRHARRAQGPGPTPEIPPDPWEDALIRFWASVMVLAEARAKL